MGNTPQVGDVANWGTEAGAFGHVAYVYAVSNGQASIAEYNWGTAGSFGSSRKVGSVGTAGAPSWYIHLGTPSGSDTYGDKQVLQASDNGNLFVMAGGAKFQFSSMQEFYGLGYSTTGMQSVGRSTIDAIPTMPRNKTILRSASGGLFVVAGRARFNFGSMSEYYGQGYADSSWINVPQAPLNAINTAPSNVPDDLTVLQQPDGSLSVMAGGVKFAFGNMNEYYGEGYTDIQMVHVSQSPAATLPTAPTVVPGNKNVLVSPAGAVYVLAGGTKSAFATMSEYYALGYTDGQVRRVGTTPLDGILTASTANPPASGTVVKFGNNNVYVFAAGVLFYENSMTELGQLGYSSNNIVTLPDAGLTTFGQPPTVVPPDGTLLSGTNGVIYLMQTGQRYAFTSMTQFTSKGYQTSQIMSVPMASLTAVPYGGYVN